MGRRHTHGALWALALAAAAQAAPAQEDLPKWELGMGAAALRIPDYRGSDHERNYLLPLPYLIYRGETVKVDKEGAHADIFKSDHVRLDISFNAGPPAKSSDNGARQGMPDIDPTLEGGPVLKILLGASRDREHVFSLRLPVRTVIATDFSHFRNIGWTFTPHLNYDALDLGPAGGWNLGIAAGLVYANEKYHDYYYEVAPQYATAGRPAYNARSGYSGRQFTIALSRRYPRYWAGAFVRYDDLSDAVIEDSPLVRKDRTVMFGGGIAWVFARSAQTVRVEPELLR
jgi:outer membrane scaffolding protein for murein synthesis (MipA/OmpV family)